MYAIDDFAALFRTDMKTAFFINLAVKMKLHLDKPREQGHDHQNLLDFYDQFPFCQQFIKIKPRHYKTKALRPPQKSRAKTILTPETMVFGQLNEEMDEGFLSESDEDLDSDQGDGLEDDL